jgi:uncharacterized Zn-finger protein
VNLNATEKQKEAAEKKLELPPFHHVVKVKPSKTRKIDTKLKLGEKGELVCSTCHGLEDIDKTPVKDVDTEAKDFLQGGPYKPLTDFCYRCHDKEANTRENIHILLDENGEIKKQQCEYCHEEVPDREKKLSLIELKLRLPMESICYGCHLKSPHFNAVEHQVKPESKEMLAHLKKMRKEKNIFIPLSAKGEVMCVSCHTPHQRGVIDINKPAGKQVDNDDLKEGITYQKHPWTEVFEADKTVRVKALNQELKTDYKLSYQRIDKEALLRLPAKNGGLCLSCHFFEQ